MALDLTTPFQFQASISIRGRVLYYKVECALQAVCVQQTITTNYHII